MSTRKRKDIFDHNNMLPLVRSVIALNEGARAQSALHRRLRATIEAAVDADKAAATDQVIAEELAAITGTPASRRAPAPVPTPVPVAPPNQRHAQEQASMQHGAHSPSHRLGATSGLLVAAMGVTAVMVSVGAGSIIVPVAMTMTIVTLAVLVFRGLIHPAAGDERACTAREEGREASGPYRRSE